MEKKIREINHKNFLRDGGSELVSRLINEETYNNALNLAKENETQNEVKNLLVSINGIAEMFAPDEKIEVVNETKTENPIEITQNTNEEEMKWIEGALNIQNKNAFEKNEYQEMQNANTKLTNELNGLYVEQETLLRAREDALNKFDVAEVVKIDEKLKNIKNLYQNKINDVNNIKNTIKTKEDGYKEKLAQLEESLKDVNYKDNNININKDFFGNNVLNEYKNVKVYDMVKSFLSNYSKSEGKRLLENTPELISALGENYKVLLGELNK